MDYNALVLFAITEGLLSLSPGPAVLLVVGLSLRSGFKLGFAATLGIISTNAVYFSLSALGIGAVIIASATIFTVIKWTGAAYLAYLGYEMLKPMLFKNTKPADNNQSALNLNEAKAIKVEKNEDFLRAFIRGFILQASNPKNIVFFVAILPQFITPGDDVAFQLLIFGIVSVLLELPILVCYGLASAKCAQIMKQKVVDWIEAGAGVLLICMGVALALYRRVE